MNFRSHGLRIAAVPAWFRYSDLQRVPSLIPLSFPPHLLASSSPPHLLHTSLPPPYHLLTVIPIIGGAGEGEGMVLQILCVLAVFAIMRRMFLLRSSNSAQSSAPAPTAPSATPRAPNVARPATALKQGTSSETIKKKLDKLINGSNAAPTHEVTRPLKLQCQPKSDDQRVEREMDC